MVELLRHLWAILMSSDLMRILVTLVAVYGAIISTITFRAQRKEKQKRIRVTLRVERATHLPNSKVFLKASNSGHRTVKLVGCCINLPGGVEIRDTELEGKPFPIELHDGDSYECSISVVKIGVKLPENPQSLRARIPLSWECWDGTDEKFKSKRIKFCVSDYFPQ